LASPTPLTAASEQDVDDLARAELLVPLALQRPHRGHLILHQSARRRAVAFPG
jgi:hypothetical protein